MQTLHPAQTWLIRDYLYALARLGGRTFNGMPKDVPNEMLQGFTGLYIQIMTEGGGRPVLAAEKTVKKMTLTGRFGRAAKAYPDFWLEQEQYYINDDAVCDDASRLLDSFLEYFESYRSLKKS